jgi:von Willebrand factor type A domain/Squalene-hopene cyclase C-terminal domain
MKKIASVLAGVAVLGVAAFFAARAFRGGPAPGANTSVAPIPAATSAAAPQGTPAAAAEPAPATTTPAAVVTASNVTAGGNLALADTGGQIEEQTGAYGAGYFGRRLIDGKLEPAWNPVRPFTYPVDVVLSFFHREPALISAVTITLDGYVNLAPKDVEIWTSADSAIDHFTKAAAQSLDAKEGDQTINFDPVECRYVKLRILSGASPANIDIAEVRVTEASRAGYMALAARNPDVATWPRSPRQAAQLGLDWLQQSAVDWQGDRKCFGCHVQAQVLMGQAVAMKHDYAVNRASFDALVKGTREYKGNDGSWFNQSLTATQFATMSLAYADDATGRTEDPDLIAGANYIVAHQSKDGSIEVDHSEWPIVRGMFMTTANAVTALSWADQHTKDSRYRPAADRGLAWIAANKPETTQDRVYKILALTAHGTADQKLLVTPLVEQLLNEQQTDGGWMEHGKQRGSNALSTGQVLYALKQAGVSVHAPFFTRGVAYLMETQVHDTPTPANGSWKATNTDSNRPTDFAHTMWAVIGLAGSYSATKTGSLAIVARLQQQAATQPPARNLEVVLDVSGSMNEKLGDSTRWNTALGVLDQLLKSLPEDFNVGLRVYGHRYGSRDPKTCTDTELVVPLVKLDRDRLLAAANKLRPRGETPLVYSVLQTVGDLKSGGGDGSVILITDGEESCKGDLKTAAQTLKTSAVHLTLNIVGFTIQGKATEEQLGGLAEATGGRYYRAQNGSELTRALMLASVNRLPFEVFDTSGKSVATAQTSPLGVELPPGDYRVVVHALGQDLEERVTIVAEKTATLTVTLKDGKFVIER